MILSKSGERWCVGLIHLRPSTRRQQPSLPSNHAPQPSAPRHLTLLRPHTAILCIRSARQVPIGPSLQPHAPAEEFHPTARAAPLCSAVAACTCTALSPHRQTQTTKRTIDAAVFLRPGQVTIFRGKYLTLQSFCSLDKSSFSAAGERVPLCMSDNILPAHRSCRCLYRYASGDAKVQLHRRYIPILLWGNVGRPC